VSRLSKGLLFLALLALGTTVFLPLWRVRLFAPQYKDGLGMLIYAGRITSEKPYDLQNINGLNHYVGMKRIEPEAIPELKFMPFLIGFMLIGGLGALLSGKRGLVLGWVAALALLGLLGLADFWRWEYDYGHNLDPSAAIKVPGMAYQPPLIGQKQLLNFTAVSWPDVGGILAGASFVLGCMALLVDNGPLKRKKGA
jgi:copper chaperone NosL